MHLQFLKIHLIIILFIEITFLLHFYHIVVSQAFEVIIENYFIESVSFSGGHKTVRVPAEHSIDQRIE